VRQSLFEDLRVESSHFNRSFCVVRNPVDNAASVHHAHIKCNIPGIVGKRSHIQQGAGELDDGIRALLVVIPGVRAAPCAPGFAGNMIDCTRLDSPYACIFEPSTFMSMLVAST